MVDDEEEGRDEVVAVNEFDTASTGGHSFVVVVVATSSVLLKVVLLQCI